MTENEFQTFEAAKESGQDAIAQVLASMPDSEFALGNEIMLARANGLQAANGPEAVSNPAATGFLVGASSQLAGALVLLSIHQPQHQSN